MAGASSKQCLIRTQCWLLFYNIGPSAAVGRSTVVRGSPHFPNVTCTPVPVATWYMGHLCKHTGVQGKRLANNQGIGHLGYLLIELSTQGAQIALKTKAILTGPSYNFPSMILVPIFQSCLKITNPLIN